MFVMHLKKYASRTLYLTHHVDCRPNGSESASAMQTSLHYFERSRILMFLNLMPGPCPQKLM